MRPIAAASLLVALSACCSGVSTDPRSGGLAGGVCGTQTGAYKARLKERENTLDSLSAIEARLEQRAAVANTEASELDLRIQALSGELEARLNRVKELNRQIKESRSKVTQTNYELAKIERVNESLRQQIVSLLERTHDNQRRIRALESGIEQARDERTIDRARLSADEEEAKTLDNQLRLLEQRAKQLLAKRQ